MVVKMASYEQMRMSKLDNATIEKMPYTAQTNPFHERGGMNAVLYNLYKIFDRDWFVNPLFQIEEQVYAVYAKKKELLKH